MARVVKYIRFIAPIAPVSARAYADMTAASPFWNLAVSEQFARARAVLEDDGSISYTSPGHAPMRIPESSILSCCWVEEALADPKASAKESTVPTDVSSLPTGGANAPKVTVKGKF